MDGEQAFREKKQIVFAADQRPFEIPGGSGHVNRFCILQGLMSLDGDRLSADRESFPNRGRVWWLLRNDIREDMVLPGSLWIGQLEYAMKTARDREDTDIFQVNFRTLRPAAEFPDLIEVLPVPEDDPDPDWVRRPVPMPWPRPTAPIVLLQGRKSVLGPLRAAWQPSDGRLLLTARSTGKPEVLRVPLDAFRHLARVERFNLTLCEHDNESEPVPATLTLSRLNWLDLERLRQAGEVLDASSDAQVLSWAVRQQVLPMSQATALKQLLADLGRDGQVALGEEDAKKLERLKQIGADAVRVLQLGEDIARSLAELPAFGELIARHVEKLAALRVAEEVQKRNKEIEEQTAEKRRKLKQVESDLKHVEEAFSKRAAAEEEQLKHRQETALRAVTEREQRVAAREQKAADAEKNVVQRLERVVERYKQEGDKVGEELLLHLPLLRKLMPVGSNGTETPRDLFRAPAPAAVPAFVHSPKARPAGPPLAEADFIEQFARLVEQAGFVFAREDLINLHVCVKTGQLTVLAGMSGTGKSSLPRLYAEALGCGEEYLHVPVRPDWLDDRDLIGAFNAVAQRFEPATSGLVERLIAAAEDRLHHRGGIYLICLDEMNLARVEHYFAQFLSVLELPPTRRYLALFSQGLAAADDPYREYHRLLLGDNVRFLGTVNIDETTHFFSPKVLDRSQVVAFGTPNLEAPRRMASSSAKPPTPVLLDTWLSWRRPGATESTARAFLLRINEVLRRSRLGIGFRQFDRMLDYVASARPFLAEDRALDLQLSQVILPRLRPTAPNFAETLQALRQVVTGDRFPRTADHLARLAEARAEDDFFQLL